MNSDMMHLTDEALEEYADGVMEGGAFAGAGRHLEECSRCAARLHSLQTTGEYLRSLPLEHPAPGFTRAILERIDEAGSARALSLAGWLAGIFGMVCVGGAILAVFAATGVLSLEGTRESTSVLQRYWVEGWGAVSGALPSTAKWFGLHEPASRTLTIVLLPLAVLVFLGGVDRLLGRRLRRDHLSA